MKDRLWRWRERVRRLLGSRRVVESEVLDEMLFHVEKETERRIAEGMSPAEARRAALIDFGSVERYRAEARESRWGHSIDVVRQDIRYGIRMLIRSPGFTLVALLTLALGIGATTAVFSLVDAVLFRPLPYPESERAMWIQTSWAGKPQARISPAEFLDYRDRLDDSFEAVGVYAMGAVNVSGDGQPERWRTAFLTPGVLPALGVAPAIGRNFTEDEELAGASLILLADSTWRGRFGGDLDILGRTVLLDGVETEIIGVLPADFRLPEDFFSGESTSAYSPHGIDPAQVTNRGSHYLSGVARRRTGVDQELAASAVEGLAAQMGDEHPDAYKKDMRFAATATPIAEIIRGSVKLPLLVLAGAVAFMLLITCTNVASLLLSRVDRRERELALRAAIGAGRGRIVTQVTIENLLLAFFGGAIGLVIAQLCIEAFAALTPIDLPWVTELALDGRILMIGLSLSFFTAFLFGLIPAVRGSARSLAAALGSGARSSSGVGSQKTRSFLAVGEIALALVLLAGAGLMARSFSRLLDVDPGFRTDNVLTVELDLPSTNYDEPRVLAFFEELERRVTGVAGVIAAGAVTNLPLATSLGDMDFEIEGRPLAAGENEPAADWQVATPGYIETLGLTLERGRGIGPHDRPDSMGVVVINKTFAETHWPQQDPIGKRFRLLGEGTRPEIAEVIGVVGDVRHEGLDQASIPQMYFPHQQFRFWGSGRPAPSMTLTVHSQLEATELQRAIERVVFELDPTLPLSGFRTMAEVRSSAVAMPRLLTTALGAFSTIALILAALGVYGAMAEGVAKRLPELGIRLALGAKPAEVSLMVVRQGLRLTLVGVVAGIVGAFTLTRTMTGLLFETSPNDTTTFVVVVIVLAVTAIFACWAPARRASTIDPVCLLRSE